MKWKQYYFLTLPAVGNLLLIGERKWLEQGAIGQKVTSTNYNTYPTATLNVS